MSVLTYLLLMTLSPAPEPAICFAGVLPDLPFAQTLRNLTPASVLAIKLLPPRPLATYLTEHPKLVLIVLPPTASSNCLVVGSSSSNTSPIVLQTLRTLFFALHNFTA